MFKINALDHVALSVRDVSRSAQWYAEVFGFKRLHEDKWNGIPVFVGNGDAAIALFPASEEIGSASADRAAVRTLHFAFRTDRENFSQAQNELKKRAIPFEFQDHEISHSIYFRDRSEKRNGAFAPRHDQQKLIRPLRMQETTRWRHLGCQRTREFHSTCLRGGV